MTESSIKARFAKSRLLMKRPLFLLKANFAIKHPIWRLITLLLILFYSPGITEAITQYGNPPNPSPFIPDSIWLEAQGYLLDNHHPIKSELDQLFSQNRIIENSQTAKLAKCEFIQLSRLDKVAVFKHPNLPGYIMKAFLDSFQLNISEFHSLKSRIIGARLVKESIKQHHFEHLFKVPEKWLYLLPNDPPPHYMEWRATFILIENEMDILNAEKNIAAWRSNQHVTRELLDAMYVIASEVGLKDIKPSNCPFCEDGKVAFIDTADPFNIPIPRKLTPFLSRQMKAYWNSINATNRKRSK